MVAERNDLHDKFSSEIRAELGRHRISIATLAEEVNRTRTSVNLWLLRNTTQERYDIMHAAIKRIVAKKEEKK